MTPSRRILIVLIAATAVAAAQSQPDSSGPDWKPLFAADLADADKPAGVWSIENGELTAEMVMTQWTSAKTNPDGMEIPAWLSTPFAQLPTRGRIGLQDKHGHATVWFRNVSIKHAKPDLPESPANAKANKATPYPL